MPNEKILRFSGDDWPDSKFPSSYSKVTDSYRHLQNGILFFFNIFGFQLLEKGR